MNKHQVLSLSLLSLIFISAPARALPPETGFFLGAGYGSSALNNDGYIYSVDNNSRQPAMNIIQRNNSKNVTSAFYGGYNFSSTKTEILGKNMFQLGVQAGYADLGKYRIDVRYESPVTTGYRALEESASNLLLTAALYWESGFNLFLKTGMARLQGKYTQEGLLTARNPSFIPAKETHIYTVVRPELAAGAGVLLFNRFNLFLQYSAIMGETAETGNNRFGTNEMVELPNTLSRADSLTAGITFFF